MLRLMRRLLVWKLNLPGIKSTLPQGERWEPESLQFRKHVLVSLDNIGIIFKNPMFLGKDS